MNTQTSVFPVKITNAIVKEPPLFLKPVPYVFDQSGCTTSAAQRSVWVEQDEVGIDAGLLSGDSSGIAKGPNHLLIENSACLND